MKADEQLRSERRRELDAIPSQLDSCNLMAMSQVAGRPVLRFPEQLRLHRALDELGLIPVVDDLNEAARLKDQSMPEPILITTRGTILAGFGHWRSAFFDGRPEIRCIEYPLSDDQALQFILKHHQPQRGWNAFIRIRLALKLEPYFQQKALDNMRGGGKYKGLANLPEAQHVDVRREIAQIAGVGSRNVSNVKAILQTAHSRLIDTLGQGTVSIHRALEWSGLPKKQQLEQLTRYMWKRTRNKLVRQAIAQPKAENVSLDPRALLNALRRQEMQQPGSVILRVSRLRRTTVFIGEDLLTDLYSQGVLHGYEIPRSTQTDSLPNPAPLGPGSDPPVRSPGLSQGAAMP
jgi:hypothetical protein